MSCENVTCGGEICQEFGVGANPLVELFEDGAVDDGGTIGHGKLFLLLRETSHQIFFDNVHGVSMRSQAMSLKKQWGSVLIKNSVNPCFPRA